MPTGYNHLTRDQRCQLYALKASGFSQRYIAEKLGVSESTISRELLRNQGKRGYRFQQADTLATERRTLASRIPRRMTPEVIEKIEQHLQEKWSPEQISGRLKLEGVTVSHERIYQHVWADKKSGGFLYTHLRHHGKKYHKRSSDKAGRACIPNRVDIEKRPKIVDKMQRIGDWEGDTIIGAEHKGAILSYVERKSKMTVLAKLPRKTAKAVVKATLKRFKGLPCFTITYDNGKEFSSHEKISKKLGIACYFARPYCSWQRALNEHTNGLVRQFFPKSSDLSQVAHHEIRYAEKLLNNRPRKVLGYLKPNEVFV